MYNVSTLKSSVDRNWADTQGLIEQNIRYLDEGNDVVAKVTVPVPDGYECEACGVFHYENEPDCDCPNEEDIAGHETNEHLEQS